jgi:hypothetical protein
MANLAQYCLRSYFYSNAEAHSARVLHWEHFFEAQDDSAAIDFAKQAFDEAICIADHVEIVRSDKSIVWQDGLRLSNGEFGNPRSDANLLSIRSLFSR